MTNPATGFKRFIAALDRLGIRYMIGGPVASSLHGIARATRDIGLVAEMWPQQAGPLAVHLPSMYKYDVFPLSADPFQQSQFRRREIVESDLLGERLAFPLCTAEDIIIAKLGRYKAGGGISDQQWRDVLGVMRIQGEGLDLGYLWPWAKRLDLEDLLERALAEAGLTRSSEDRPR